MIIGGPTVRETSTCRVPGTILSGCQTLQE